MNIVIFGYGYYGAKLYRELLSNNKGFNILGFADNSSSKQGCIVNGKSIFTLEQLVKLAETVDFQVIIALKAWHIVGKQLENREISIKGVYDGNDEYSCGSKSQIRKFGNQSSGTRKSSFLCLITVPFLWEYLSRPCRICGA